MDKQYPGRIKDGPQTMLDKLNNTASGYGIVKFRKEQQEITLESWPIYEDMSSEISRYKTHKGWPITVSVDQQYNRKPIGYLPIIKMKKKNFIVRVVNELSGDLVYARRVTGNSFRPKVFEKGHYLVEAGRPGEWKSFKNQKIK